MSTGFMPEINLCYAMLNLSVTHLQYNSLVIHDLTFNATCSILQIIIQGLFKYLPVLSRTSSIFKYFQGSWKRFCKFEHRQGFFKHANIL